VQAVPKVDAGNGLTLQLRRCEQRPAARAA
jgi:hypothetical protein